MKMRPRHWLVLLVVIGMASGPAHAMTVGDAIGAMADLLREGQLLEGTWRMEAGNMSRSTRDPSSRVLFPQRGKLE
ncbi:MAG: hypothetical protein IIA65_02455 [Planctomycetes bacterium]|nr:hypothetical protein [Planctomycetota bacterium]